VSCRLRNGHTFFASEVVQLANVSLLRQRDQWTQEVIQVQKAVAMAVQAAGCQESDTKPWKAHGGTVPLRSREPD